MIRILVFGVLIGVALNELVHRRRQRAESEAFWNSPYMLEQRREHDERMKHDPKYRLRVAETEAIYGAP
jgi:hypothetical protein